MKTLKLLIALLFLTGCDSAETFSGSEEVTFSPVPSGKQALAEVENTYGSMIRSDTLLPGTTRYTWDGKDESGIEVSNGLYILTITLDGKELASTAAIIKR